MSTTEQGLNLTLTTACFPQPPYLLEYVLTMIGTSYGQKRPPLTHILQSILDRYPDGGQILKVFNDQNNQTVDSSSYKDNEKNLCIFLSCLND